VAQWLGPGVVGLQIPEVGDPAANEGVGVAQPFDRSEAEPRSGIFASGRILLSGCSRHRQQLFVREFAVAVIGESLSTSIINKTWRQGASLCALATDWVAIAGHGNGTVVRAMGNICR
jgi:hypothetical protein